MDVTLDFRLVLEAPQLPSMLGWRVLHDPERGALWRGGVPEVYPVADSAVELDANYQRLIYNLNTPMNPLVGLAMEKKKFRALCRHDKAFTNKPPNGYDGGIPHPDYINGLDIGAPDPLRQDKVRFCGGMLVRGVVEGDKLHMRRGIDFIDGNLPAPSLSAVLDNGWYFDALNISPLGNITRFPQNSGERVFWILVSRVDIYYPLSGLQEWTADTPPDPYTIYR